jgi:hypothetical protein
MTHPVSVALLRGADIQIGAFVTLGIGSPPTVNAGNDLVGVINDDLAQGLGRCLLDGYRLAGTVDNVDLEGRFARIAVSGERKET